MRDSVTVRQRRAWMLCAGSVPAVIVCAGISWQWALLGGAAAAAILWLCAWLQREQDGRTLAECGRAALGEAGWEITAAAAAVWTVLVLARVTREAGRAFPESHDPVGLGLALLLLAAVACRNGELVPARCAGVLAAVLGGLYAALLLACAQEAEVQWLRPWGDARQGAAACGYLLLPGAACYLGERPEGRRCVGSWTVLLAAAAPAAFAAVTAGCLSPRLAAIEELPFYEAVQGLSGLAVLRRLEPLASAAMLLGYFCAMTLLLCAAGNVLRKKARKWQYFLPAIAAGAVSFAVERLDWRIWAAGGAVFWGLFPMGILFVGYCRKKAKK